MVINEAQWTGSNESPASASSTGGGCMRPLREVSRSTRDLVSQLAEIREGQKSFDGKVAALASLSQTVAAFLATDGKSIEKLRCGQSSDSYAISRLEEVLTQTMAEVIDMLREHQGALRTMSTDMEAVLDRLKHLEMSLLVEDTQFLDTLSSSKLARERQQQVEQMAADLERRLQALTSSQFRQLARQSASSFVAKILLQKVAQGPHQGPQEPGESARVGLEPAAFSRIRRLTREMDSETLCRLGAAKPAEFPVPPTAKSSASSSPQRLEKIAVVAEPVAQDPQLPSWTLEFRRALDVAAARYSATKASPRQEQGDGEPLEDSDGKELSSPYRKNGFHSKLPDLLLDAGLTTVEEGDSSGGDLEVDPVIQLDCGNSKESDFGQHLRDLPRGQDVFALFRQRVRAAGSCAIAAEADCRLVEAELTRMSSRLDFQGQPLIGQLTCLAARLSELRMGLQTAEQTLASSSEATAEETRFCPGGMRRDQASLSASHAEANEVQAPSQRVAPEPPASTALAVATPCTSQASLPKPAERKVESQTLVKDLHGVSSRTQSHVPTSTPSSSDASTWNRISQQMQRLQAARGNSASASKSSRTPGTSQNGVSPSYAERQREQQRKFRGTAT